ncbi:hypothetical protein LTR85_008574 [Meristemomyces frigidus]|nr:hypothetical protein LTR85_008574 [Meristemomyces frigidus]
MFAKALVISGLAALSAAQSAVLTFTKVPNPVTDGVAEAITYSTNDTTTPVTIILRKGASGNLQTVSTLTSSATGGQYIWTPSTSLADGTDYALEITQGSQINYFGPFEIQGAVASAVSSASSSSATASASSYISSTVSTNGTASTTVPIAPATSGTAASGASAGTGTAMIRNSTMSMATLTASSSATSSAGSPSSNSAASTASSGSSSSASASSSTPTNSASAVQMGTTMCLLLGAAAAVFYLQ